MKKVLLIYHNQLDLEWLAILQIMIILKLILLNKKVIKDYLKQILKINKKV